MHNKSIATSLSALALCLSAALAQPVPPPPPDKTTVADKGDRHNHLAQMCQDRLAHAVGEMAYLETKLALTDQQKPLFERWKKIKLDAAKAAAKGQDCAAPPGGKPSITDLLKHEEKALKARLDELKAEIPALEALAASLSDDQKNAFAPPLPPPEGMRQGMGHGPHGQEMDPGPDRSHGDGPQEGSPPEF